MTLNQNRNHLLLYLFCVCLISFSSANLMLEAIRSFVETVPPSSPLTPRPCHLLSQVNTTCYNPVCEPTCEKLDPDEAEDCSSLYCEAGCKCAPGYVRDKRWKCIPIEKCQIKCNGPHEQLIQISGGCYQTPFGELICEETKPPMCQCVMGYRRNKETDQCERIPRKGCNSANRYFKPHCLMDLEEYYDPK